MLIMEGIIWINDVTVTCYEQLFSAKCFLAEGAQSRILEATLCRITQDHSNFPSILYLTPNLCQVIALHGAK